MVGRSRLPSPWVQVVLGNLKETPISSSPSPPAPVGNRLVPEPDPQLSEDLKPDELSQNSSSTAEVVGGANNVSETSISSSPTPEKLSPLNPPPPVENPMVPEPDPQFPEILESVDFSQNSSVAEVVGGVNTVSEEFSEDFSVSKSPEKSSVDSPKRPVDSESSITESCQESATSHVHDKDSVNSNSSSSNEPLKQERSVKHDGGSHPELSSVLPRHEETLKHFPRETRTVAGSSGHSHAHGNGSNHDNYGGRRDHAGAPRFWSTSHFNARGAHRPPFDRGQGQGYVRSPEEMFGAFMYPPLPPAAVMTPYTNMMLCPDFTLMGPVPLDYCKGMPFRPLPPPPANMFRHPVSVPDPLPSMIVKQIDYYFSEYNLVKDLFLRSKMDGEGWVPISLIASFPRVKKLTKSIAFIQKSLRFSNVVQVQGYRLRKRDNWRKWIPPHFLNSSNVERNQDEPAAAVQAISSGSMNSRSDELSGQPDATNTAC